MNSFTGQSIGRYHIIEPLGEGGMAVVYKAYDTHLECEVAVKVIRIDNLPRNAEERALKRFEREAKAVAKLNHPNIVKVTDYGEEDGKPYLVMPYLPGGTLKELIKERGQIPWQEAAQLLTPIAEALAYAHSQGVIHRDVKPSNILLTSTGQPMLTDFGVAKVIEDEATQDLTGTSATVGTPEYMAPEQITSKTVDARADLYSLGVVFYEMVTGRKPFEADTPMAVLFKHASESLPRPSQFVSGLPKGVEYFLIKALTKKPDDRYQSAEEMINSIHNIPVQNKWPLTLENNSINKNRDQEVQQPKKQKTALILGIILLVVIGIILLVKGNFSQLIVKNTTADPSQSQSISSTQETSSAQIPAYPLDFEVDEVLFREDFNGNENQWPTGNDENGTYYIDSGEYHIIGQGNKDGWLAPNLRSEQSFDDFYLEVKVTYVEGSQKGDTFGILFRYSDNVGPYLLMISNPQQNYSLHTEGPLISWTYTPRINKTGENIIGILCEGNEITIFINGARVDSIKSEYSDSGGIGFAYASQTYSKVDYIYLWKLKK